MCSYFLAGCSDFVDMNMNRWLLSLSLDVRCRRIDIPHVRKVKRQPLSHYFFYPQFMTSLSVKLVSHMKLISPPTPIILLHRAIRHKLKGSLLSK